MKKGARHSRLSPCVGAVHGVNTVVRGYLSLLFVVVLAWRR